MSAVFQSSNIKIEVSQQLTACGKNDSQRSKGIVKLVLHWFEVSKQRKHLAKLDDRMLSDIGLSRDQAEAEISKPFWK